jgi:hypothetical protein
MSLFKPVCTLLVIFAACYEVFMAVYAKTVKATHWTEHFMNDLNFLFDHIVMVYAAAVVFICLYYAWKKSTKMVTMHYPSIKKIGTEDWKVTIQGTWHQYEAENLEEFSHLTEESQIRRTLGALAFFKVRHTISISSGYFNLQRDLGMSEYVWNLKAKIGTSRDQAEPALVEVETGGRYSFRIWSDEEKKELHMESTPADGQEGVTTLQTRTLLSKDELKMVRVHLAMLLC